MDDPIYIYILYLQVITCFFDNEKSYFLNQVIMPCHVQIETVRLYWLSYSLSLTTWGQFHQHSTCSFYVRKLFAQLFCAYILGLYFTGARLLAQKLSVEYWWNWHLTTNTNEDCQLNSWSQFYQHSTVSFCSCLFTRILMAYRVRARGATSGPQRAISQLEIRLFLTEIWPERPI